jgi:hypothetical protein
MSWGYFKIIRPHVLKKISTIVHNPCRLVGLIPMGGEVCHRVSGVEKKEDFSMEALLLLTD